MIMFTNKTELTEDEVKFIKEYTHTKTIASHATKLGSKNLCQIQQFHQSKWYVSYFTPIKDEVFDNLTLDQAIEKFNSIDIGPELSLDKREFNKVGREESK